MKKTDIRTYRISHAASSLRLVQGIMLSALLLVSMKTARADATVSGAIHYDAPDAYPHGMIRLYDAATMGLAQELEPFLYETNTFLFTNVAPGSFKIRFEPDMMPEREAQWYDRADTMADAATVTVTNSGVYSNISFFMTNAPAAVTSVLSVSTASLSNTMVQGQVPSAATVQVWNAGAGEMAFSISSSDTNLITVQPVGGICGTNRVTIRADYSAGTAALTAGVYTTTIALMDDQDGWRELSVTLTVTPPPYQLAVSTTAISRAFIKGQAMPPEELRLWNASSSRSMYWSVSCPPWMSVSPSNGTCADVPQTINAWYRSNELADGTNRGTIAFSSSTGGDAVTVSMEVTVSDPLAYLLASPGHSTVTMEVGTTNAVTKYCQVRNYIQGQTNMHYSFSDDADWLDVVPSTGSSTGQYVQHEMRLTNLAAMAQGTYTATVEVTSGDAPNVPQLMKVTLDITPLAPAIGVTTSSIAFSAMQGRNADRQNISIWNAQAGAATLHYTLRSSAAWLSISPTNGQCYESTNSHTLNAVTATLAAGRYQGGVIIEATNASVTRRVVNVDLTVEPSPQVIATAPNLPFGVAPIGMETGTVMEVWNSGTGELEYSLASDAAWLKITPTNGVSSGGRQQHILTFAATNLPEGEYTGTISVVSADAANSPLSRLALFRVQGSVDRLPRSIRRTIAAGGVAAPETLRIWNAGSTNDLGYTLQKEAEWLHLSSTNGSSDGVTNEVEVTFDSASLEPGVYSDWLLIIPRDGATYRSSVYVSLSVSDEAGSYLDATLFDSKRNGTRDIWLLRSGATNAECLIERQGAQWGARVSPDGSKLAFLDDSSGKTELVVRDLPSGTETRFDALSSLRWSGDGQSLYGVLATESGSSIRRQYLSGSGELILSERGVLDLYGVTSGGEKLLYAVRPSAGSYNSAVYSYDVSRKQRSIVQPADGRYDGAGDLRGDDGMMCYEEALRGALQPYRMMLRDLTSGREVLLSGASNSASDYDPSFTPNGSNVLFVAEDSNGVSRIMQAAVDDGNLTEVYSETQHALRRPVRERLFVPVPQNPAIGLSRTGITNTVIINTTNLFYETFELWNAGNSTLDYAFANAAPWCWVQGNQNGTSTGEHDTITVAFYVTNLAAGTYTDTLHISGNGTNAPIEFPLQTTIEPPLPVLSVLPETLSSLVTTGSLTAKDFLSVQNLGGRDMAYTVTVDSAWMRTEPASGSTTGEIDGITVYFDGAGLGVTNVAGEIAVSGAGVTQAVPVSLTVSDPRTNPPVLYVSTNAFNVTAHERRTVSGEHIQVSNIGGSEMVYWYIWDWDDSGSWINIPMGMSGWREEAPFYTRGVGSRLPVIFQTEVLSEGIHVETITVHTATCGSTNIVVTANILPVETFEVSVNRDGAGTVTTSTNRFAVKYNDTITLTAHPDPGCGFERWSGDSSSRETQITLRVTSDMAVTAHFKLETRIGGVVSNSITGEKLQDVEVVWHSAYTTRTDRLGLYHFSDADPGHNLLVVTHPGYEQGAEMLYLMTWDRAQVDFGLVPDVLDKWQLGVCAEQRPNTRLVDIEYTLKLTENDFTDIALAVSADDGATWSIPCESVRGDVGGRVRCGGERHIVWDAGADYPFQRSTNMRVKVIATRYGDSWAQQQSFALDTRGVENWRLRCWYDNNHNNDFDEGEQMATAEVYVGGRTTNDFLGWTDQMGFIDVPSTSFEGVQLFARKLLATEYRHKNSIPAFDDENIMLKIYADSDIGGEQESNWNGEWQTFVLSDQHVRRLANGLPLYLKLGHPLFVWNLYAGFVLNDNSLRYALENCFRQASEFLYDITDGQMKLGGVNLCMNVYTDQKAWRNADLKINTEKPYRANATVNGRRKESGYINMGYQSPGLYGTKWGPTLIHEWGHYGFGFRDEYLNGWGQTGKWREWRNEHPGVYPGNFGFMENQTLASGSEMSSWNDYWASYGFDQDPRTIPRQIFTHYLASGADIFSPCWDDLATYFGGTWGGYNIRLIEPPYGWFEGGASTSQDRAGPTNIPAPYSIINFRAVTNAVRGARSRAMAIPHIADVQVTRNGAPVRGARVLREHAGKLLPYGRTDANGYTQVEGCYAGDVLIVRFNGQQASAPFVPRQPVHIRLRDVRTVYSPGTNGLVTRASLDAATNLSVEIISRQPLADAPFVVWYPDAGNVTTVTVSQVDARRSTFTVAAGGTRLNRFLISCMDTQSVSFSGQLGVQLCESVEGSYWSSDDGSTELFFNRVAATQFMGQISQCDAPVILPAGMAYTNQIGPCINLSLTAPGLLSATNTASLIYYCDEADLAQIDVTTLEMYRWNDAATNWVACSAGVDRVEGSVSTIITNEGTFVVLGNRSADTTPPAAVTNLLAVTGSKPGFIDLSWTATGNDGTNGTAYAYHLYYGAGAVDLTNGDYGPYVLSKAPAAAGTPETWSLKMDEQATAYAFMLRVADEAGNISDDSNTSEALAAILDANQNGLPDDWEDTYNIGLDSPMALDDDTDNDGLSTVQEYELQTDPRNADTDGDGMSDKWEHDHGLNPLSITDGSLDNDADTLLNSAEYGFGTNPDNSDTDGDAMRDDWEIAKKLDPSSTSGDNGADTDPDADSAINIDEYIADTDPLDSNSVFMIDQVGGDGQRVELTFLTSSQRMYRVYSGNDLMPTNWHTFGDSFQGTGDYITRIITNENGTIFYCLEVYTP